MSDKKVCANCGNGTTYALSREVYCLDVSWWHMVVFGPRAVRPGNTCEKWCPKNKQKTR